MYFLFKKFYRTAIKRKIESVGTPLKDWDINIYRGVLTDYNEAFIISTEKRDEILANASWITSASVPRSLYDPIKAFLYILSSMDDNFASIISFINDKLGSFYPTRIYTESCRKGIEPQILFHRYGLLHLFLIDANTSLLENIVAVNYPSSGGMYLAKTFQYFVRRWHPVGHRP